MNRRGYPDSDPPAADKSVPRSLVAARVSQAISVAIQRVVAFNILEFRYTTLPKGRVPGSGVQLASPNGVGGSMLSGDDWEDEGVAEEGSAAVPMLLI